MKIGTIRNFFLAKGTVLVCKDFQERDEYGGFHYYAIESMQNFDNRAIALCLSDYDYEEF